MPALLVRYGELGLKSSSVRRRFENALVDDIKRRHGLARTPCMISSTRGRIFVDSDDWRKSCEILSRTFGVVSFSPVTEVGSELGELTEAVLSFAEPILFEGASFAIRSRRSGTHPYTSQSLAKDLGSAVLERNKPLGVTVSLDEPDVEIFVEARDDKAYLYSSVLSGPGGMPLATQGRVLSVLESERGIASTWLMMKRGCSIMASARETTLLEPLRKWYPNLKSTNLETDLFSLAQKNDCIGIALEFRLDDIERTGALKGPLPVFYPLVGMAEEDIERLLARILD